MVGQVPAIFLSHTSADNVQARDLAKALGEHGFDSLFLDIDPEGGIQAGSRWEATLYSNLIRSRAVIALHSQHWKSSRWCFAEITHAKLLGRAVIPVCLDASTLDPCLTEFQAIGLNSDPDALNRIVSGLRAVGLDPRKTNTWDGTRSPFPGLESFHPEDTAVFFGREDEVHRVVDRLALLRRLGDRQFVLLAGSSGSGKSSLLLAGVVPVLAANRGTWRVLPASRPGHQLRSTLQQSPEWLSALLGPGQPSSDVGLHSQTTVLVVDQLEELFVQSTPGEATAILRSVQSYLRGTGSALAVGTIRTDALLAFENAARTAELRYETLSLVPMNEYGLARAISGPSELDGIALDPGLVERMVRDCGDARALPLLAYTLREMYERTNPPRRFTLDLYEKQVGGIRGGLNRTLDTIMAGKATKLAIEDLRRSLFRLVRLTESGEFVKRRATMDEFAPGAVELMNRFVAARLLVTDSVGGRAIVEVAHEMIFREWHLLSSWLRDYRPFFEWERRFTQSLANWERDATTLSDNALSETLHWQKVGLVKLDTTAQALIKSSKDETRFVKTAKKVWSSARISSGLVAWWLLSGVILGQLQYGITYDLYQSYRPTCYSCLGIFLVITAFTGALAGLSAFGPRLIDVVAGSSLFLLLALPDALAAVPLDAPITWSAKIVRSLPIAIAFLVGCLLLVLVRIGNVSKVWAKGIALLAISLLCLNTLYDPNQSGAEYNPVVAFINTIMVLPSFLERAHFGYRQGLFTPLTIALLIAGLAMGWLGSRTRNRSEETDRSRLGYRLPQARSLILASLLALFSGSSCLLVGLIADLNRKAVVAVHDVHDVADRLIDWQDGVRSVRKQYARSFAEIEEVRGQLLKDFAKFCTGVPYGKDRPIPSVFDSMIKVLPEFTNFDLHGMTVEILYSDKDGWAGRVSSPSSSKLGCTMWRGDVPNAAIVSLRYKFSKEPGVACQEVFEPWFSFWNHRNWPHKLTPDCVPRN